MSFESRECARTPTGRVRRGRLVAAIPIGLLAVLGLAGFGHAFGEDFSPVPVLSGLPSRSPRIVNGTLTSAQPTTGALIFLTNPEDPVNFFSSGFCSGTLVGCETFLTAAHCVCSETGAECQPGGSAVDDPASLLVYLQHGGLFRVSEIAVQPGYEFAVAKDVAVLKLASPVVGVVPARLNTTATPSPGTRGTIVGFGMSGGFSDDFGMKRSGKVTTATCSNVPDDEYVCWNFTSPIGPPGEDSNTCFGDSGGPLFVDFGAGPVVAGVTSGGAGKSCYPDDYAFDADVFVERGFIESQGGSDLSKGTCGEVSQVGDEGTTVLFGVGALSAAQPSDGWTFEVPVGTVRLLVTLNGVQTAPNDFDLAINGGTPPLLDETDCLSVRFSQFEACEITDPEPGTWYALASRFEGEGEYQLTVTMFSGPASCGDGVLESGEECDDGNIEGGDCCSSTCEFEFGSCDDGVYCNGNDTCEAGSCTIHEGDPCSSGETCNEDDDTCEPVAQCTALTGDVDLDCTVDIVELQSCIAMFLKLAPVDPCSDPDGNGVVDIVNLQNSIAGFLRQLSCS